MTATITLTPGRATLADWHSVADGAAVRLDPAALSAVEAAARAVDAIIARGEPVYGINTGFGKLASVHIGVRRPCHAPAQYRAIACRRGGRADAAGERAADDGIEGREPRPRRLGGAAANR